MTFDFETLVAYYVTEYTEAWIHGSDDEIIALIERDGYAIGFPSLYDGAVFSEICFVTSTVQYSKFWKAICEDINRSLMDSEWGGVLRTVC
jgi:hypothetical protein